MRGGVSMLSVAWLIAALVVVAVAAGLAARWWTWRPVTRARAIVQLLDGNAVDGVIVSRRGPLLVLADVTLRIPGGSQRMDGQVVIERDRVLYVQVLR